MVSKILCDLSDANDIIEEARDKWIIDVLLALGVSEDIIELGFDSLGRDEYVYAMNELGIDVELCSNGEVDVYKKVWIGDRNKEEGGWLPPTRKHLVAQWKTPERVRRIEDNKIYYEINIKQWSIKNTRVK